MEVIGEEIVAPQNLLDSFPDAVSLIRMGRMHCMQIHLTNDHPRRGSVLFNKCTYGEQTDEFNDIRAHLRTTSTLCMFTWGNGVQCGKEKLDIVFQPSDDDNPYGKWFEPDPTKHFL